MEKGLRGKLQSVGRFYSSIIIKYIVLFLFVGLAEVFFGISGWMPNENIQNAVNIIYRYVIPCFITFGFGKRVEESAGGELAVLAEAGLLAANYRVGIAGAMIVGPVCGLLSRMVIKRVIERADARIKMLFKNVFLGLCGIIACCVSYYCLAPAIAGITIAVMAGMDTLASLRLLVFTNVLIEPAKVFFLNNGINYGILIPIGMQQAQETGKSILFLLESNPGPGMGLLLACCLMKKKERLQYEMMLFTQAIGGIHEVYFPVVLSDFRLMVPLILGGVTGNFYFMQMNVGVSGPVSPGSIITICLMGGKNECFGVLCGVLFSAAVSFFFSCLILGVQNRKQKAKEMDKITENGILEFEKESGNQKSMQGLEEKSEYQNGMQNLEKEKRIQRSIQEKKLKWNRNEEAEKWIKKIDIEPKSLKTDLDTGIEELRKQEDIKKLWELMEKRRGEKTECGIKERVGTEQMDVRQKYTDQKEAGQKEKNQKKIYNIGFICDGGMGSSVMGASIFRRRIKEAGITGIEVNHYAHDQIPEGLDLLVCQKDFYPILARMKRTEEIYSIDNLVSTVCYQKLLETIKERNG